jgi:hypothetical protein
LLTPSAWWRPLRRPAVWPDPALLNGLWALTVMPRQSISTGDLPVATQMTLADVCAAAQTYRPAGANFRLRGVGASSIFLRAAELLTLNRDASERPVRESKTL